MLTHIRPALVMILAMTLITGLAYPLAITGIAQLAMSGPANGSLILRNGAAIGSSLIGQNFAADRYFHGRPSATNATDPSDATKTIDAPYNAANSGASNLGPTSQKLIDRVKAEIAAETFDGPAPGDAVTTSASGLDPHVSPAFAAAQVARVARARSMSEAKVRDVVATHSEGRFLGLFGEPRVNVLLINLALDAAP